jgi:flagellar protein FliS
MSKAAAQYKMVNTQSGVTDASPHRLVQMLMEGFLQRVAEARGALLRKDIAGKGESIGKAINIAEGLRASLNKEAGGDLADNLEDLYRYIQQRLTEANLASDDSMLSEVSDLMKTVKEGWDGIAQDAA